MAEKQKNFFAAMMMLCLLFAGSAGLSFLLTEIQAGNYNLSEQQIAQVNVEPQNRVHLRGKNNMSFAQCTIWTVRQSK